MLIETTEKYYQMKIFPGFNLRPIEVSPKKYDILPTVPKMVFSTLSNDTASKWVNIKVWHKLTLFPLTILRYIIKTIIRRGSSYCQPNI